MLTILRFILNTVALSAPFHLPSVEVLIWWHFPKNIFHLLICALTSLSNFSLFTINTASCFLTPVTIQMTTSTQANKMNGRQPVRNMKVLPPS
jgi:hypothetical protein